MRQLHDCVSMKNNISTSFPFGFEYTAIKHDILLLYPQKEKKKINRETLEIRDILNASLNKRTIYSQLQQSLAYFSSLEMKHQCHPLSDIFASAP